jgi:hypothetical protein
MFPESTTVTGFALADVRRPAIPVRLCCREHIRTQSGTSRGPSARKVVAVVLHRNIRPETAVAPTRPRRQPGTGMPRP